MKLEVRGISMDYGAVHALDKVNVVIESGDVHGIIGENGAGKSTLLKILSGVQQPTEGEVLIDGVPVKFVGVRDSEDRGIAMIHQELNLIDTLSVAENIFLGREPKRNGLLDRATMRSEATKALASIEASIDPDMPVGMLSLAEKQLLEIAKAVARGARLVIMDEPSAVLAKKETEVLLSLVKRLREKGTTVLYVSHRLDEVIEVCDQITVLRDGQWVTTLVNQRDGDKPTTMHELANLMVGREMSALFPAKGEPTQDISVQVNNLKVEGFPEPISFNAKKGEILGLGGLVGSGRTELAEAIAGYRSCRGEVKVDGGRVAYVSEDRKGTGLHVNLAIEDNVNMANLSRYARFTLNRRLQRSRCDAWIQKLGIKVSSPEAPVNSLSGGNQQKVSLAKWLDTEPRVLILDEPTRGVDIGAKAEIYSLIVDLAAQGMTCIVISSEMNEIIGLCNRAIVLRERRVMGELVGGDITEQNLMRLAAGLAA